jgi:hypothetical protein
MTRFKLLLPAVFLVLAYPLAAQTGQPAEVREANAPAAESTSPAMLPSAILGPALSSLQQALSIARPEKWKATQAITAESASDLGSIQRDLGSTLPPLLAAADASPASVSQLLPTYRNVEALYDVLVRVTQTSVLAAPPQQSAAFQQATLSLQQARRDFGDLLDSAARAQDRRFHDVQVRLTTLQSAPPPAPAPVCPPPPPAKKAKPRAKTTAKPAPSSTAPSTSATSH